MERYIEQLLADISHATENLSWPYVKKEGGYDLSDVLSEEEENISAPFRNLQEWTGIYKEQLPPEEKLSDEQIQNLLKSLNDLLSACNWHFVLQIAVPERIQYACIRDNFDQEAQLKQWHMGFFQHCSPGTEHKKCALGEYCQCSFYAELFSGFIDEDLSPEEERARELECELKHIKRKYGSDWMKYYPYHLDKEHDDENGNPYNYGFGDEEEEEDGDDWWRK